MIVVYIVVLAWGYFAKEHISIYEVNTTDISDDAPLYGFVMRAEEIVNSEESAYINYYLSEGSRIGKGDVAYTEDTSGEVSKMLEQIRSKKDNSENISKMREVIAALQFFSQCQLQRGDKTPLRCRKCTDGLESGNLYSDLKKRWHLPEKQTVLIKLRQKKWNHCLLDGWLRDNKRRRHYKEII